MALTLGTSSTTLRMLFNVGMLESQRETTMTRLSTGKRINQAKDDPAGLVAVNAMNADLAAINAAIEGNQRSQSLLDTADATLLAVNDLVKEIENSVAKALDPTASSAQIAAWQSTVDQSLDAIDSLLNTAMYNNTSLFDGTDAEITPVATGGANLTDQHVYTRDGNATADTTITFTIAGANLTVSDGTDTMTYAKPTLGDVFSFSINGYSGRVTFKGVANGAATVKIGTTGGHMFKLGTDSSTRVAMDLGSGLRPDELGDEVQGYLSSLRSGQTNNLTNVNSTPATADTARAIASQASQQVAMAAAREGNFSKYQIGSSMKALEAMKEGTTSAISVIVDTDYAEETAKLDRQDIMLQAAVSMLARTNLTQMSVLQLLQ